MIEVAGQQFRSQEALAEAVKKILWGYPLNEHLRAPDLAFMLAVLSRHPNATAKYGTGVTAMWVAQTVVNSRGFFVLRTDSTTAGFSYKKCIFKVGHRTNIMHAMRRAVVDQIYEARNRAFTGAKEILCPLTGRPITKASCHIDHAPPNTLVALANQFFLMHPPSTIILVDGVYLGGRIKQLPEPLLGTWQRFHAANARLRAVHPDGNLKKVFRDA